MRQHSSILYHHLQGRAKTSEAGGAVVKGGGVAVAAAEEAKAKGKGPVINNFYRFQQRDKRRTGEFAAQPLELCDAPSLRQAPCSTASLLIKSVLCLVVCAELLDLRKQFDMDRKRIAEMRQGRNFKPY